MLLTAYFGLVSSILRCDTILLKIILYLIKVNSSNFKYTDIHYVEKSYMIWRSYFSLQTSEKQETCLMM